MTFPDLITRLRDGGDLDTAAVDFAAALLLDPAAGDEDKAAFLRALSAKGESPAEITAFVRTFLTRAVPVPFQPPAGRPCMDICGTGGDKLGLWILEASLAAMSAEKAAFPCAASRIAAMSSGRREDLAR